MIKDFEQLKEMLRSHASKTPCGSDSAQDEHTLEAISHAYKDGMVEPVLIGDEAAIREILNKLGFLRRA